MGLGDGLAEADGQCVVLVGAMGQRLLDEQVPGRAADGLQHPRIDDAALAQALHQPLARTPRGHADTVDIDRSHTGFPARVRAI